MNSVEFMLTILLVKLFIITNALNIPSTNNEPPKIIEGPVSTTVVEGSEVILKCRASGSLTIMWEQNGRAILPFFDYTLKILPSGDLKIDRASLHMSGEYSCRAINQYGEVKESATLYVKQKTRILKELSKFQKMRAGKTASFSCRFISDESLSVDIEWLKDGEAIDYEKQDRYKKGNDGSLTILNTILQDSGDYTCAARTSIDEDRYVITLVIRDVANSPIIEDVICNGLTAEIIWKSQGENNSPLVSYYVQYNTSITPDKWVIGKDRIRSTNLKYIMKPGVSYSFQVVAQNMEGLSAPSKPSKTCTTQPDVPHKNPDNVKTEPNDITKLVITWTPMPEIDHSGPKLHYRVFWKRDVPGSLWESKDVLDWHENKIVVDDQPVFVKYLVKVVAINEMGESKIPAKEVIGYSGEAEPLLAPENFKLVDLINEKSALLEWDPVSPESLQGEFKGYKVQTWTAAEGEESHREIHVDNDTNEINLDQLKPYSKNFVRICAYNSRADGPWSQVISIDTPEGYPSEIQNLRVYVLGPSEILLTWDKPLEPNGKLTGYSVYYQDIGRYGLGDRRESPQIFNGKEATSAKITHLYPNTNFRFSVAAKTSKGEGREYFIEAKTLAEDRPKEPSEPNFKWEPLTRIKVTWQPINGSPTGTHFFTQYRVKGQTNWEDTQEQTQADALIVDGLERDTVYEFRVVSVYGSFKKESKIQEIKTP